MKLCTGTLEIREDTLDRVYKRLELPAWGWWVSGMGGDNRPRGVKRKRLTCPKCKRKMLRSIEVCHDGCCTYHSLPPHKPKGWWKRKKKPRREKRVKRR